MTSCRSAFQLFIESRMHWLSLCMRRIRTCSGPYNKGGGPLAGIRVLDSSRVLAGPFCAMLLGDLGAEVIKVERPGVGDDSRRFGPPFMGDESIYFFSVNRNKKSVTVDFSKDKGKEIVKQLAMQSDVFIENYIPGKMDCLDLSYSVLSALNPGLIYCSVTGFGATGPYSGRGGYDVIAAAMSGLMHVTGPQDGDPVRVGVAMTDLSTGLYAHGAIMAALLHRKNTGKGQKIDCNLLSSQVSLLTHLACNYLNTGQEAQRWGTAHSSIVPYQAFKTSDSMVVVGAGNNVHFSALCNRMDLSHLPSDERYATNCNRVKHRKELITLLSKRFEELSTAEWLHKFQGCTFPYGPINNLQEVFTDPQVKHLGLVQSVQHASVGEVKLPGPAVSYSDMQQPIWLPPPTLGQHTDMVLQDVLGYSKQEIDNLRSNGVI